MALQISLGEVVKLRKPHPCGSYDWKVFRLGADIDIECLRFRQRLLLARPELVRSLKNITGAAGSPRLPEVGNGPN